jgi:hypothetical protein
MSKTVMRTYALRDSAVQVVEWTGDPDVYRFLSRWTGNRVRVSGETLLLQSPDMVEEVPLGHSIVKVSDESFFVYSPEDLKEQYLRVRV